MGKKGDLSDFERGMVVGDRRAGLNISKTADFKVDAAYWWWLRRDPLYDCKALWVYSNTQ